MATIFKHDGKERVLDTQCGTAPYAAPEVFGGKYRLDEFLASEIGICDFLEESRLISGLLGWF